MKIYSSLLCDTPLFAGIFAEGGDRTLLLLCVVGLATLIMLWCARAVWMWWHYRVLMKRVTSRKRGTPSERALIQALLKRGIHPDDIFHDLYVHTGGGKYAQVDAVALTPQGMVVFEVKEYSGRVYGRGYHDYWTQVLASGGESHRFYNPVKQNVGHIAALRKIASRHGFVPMHSVIIFYGECSLRDMGDLPYDTYVGYPSDLKKILRRIRRKGSPAAYRDVEALRQALRSAVANGAEKQVRRDHIKRIKAKTRPRRWWQFWR